MSKAVQQPDDMLKNDRPDIRVSVVYERFPSSNMIYLPITVFMRNSPSLSIPIRHHAAFLGTTSARSATSCIHSKPIERPPQADSGFLQVVVIENASATSFFA